MMFSIYVKDYMRTRFVRALAVTICAILAIKYFARIDACCARIVNVISRIVSIFLRIVRPNWLTPILAGHCHTGALFLSFSCITMDQLVFLRNMCADGDHRLRIEILTICPFSQTVISFRALIFGHNCPFAQWFTKNHYLCRSPPQGLHSSGLKPFLAPKPGIY